MRSWTRFWRLTPGERRTVLFASAALVATWLALRVSNYRVWQAVLRRAMPRQAPSLLSRGGAKDWAAVHAFARLEAAASRHGFLNFNCLERSLVLWWLLRRHGISAELRFGARKEQKLFEAHAWVEVDHKVINDLAGAHTEFTAFNSAVEPTQAELV